MPSIFIYLLVFITDVLPSMLVLCAWQEGQDSNLHVLDSKSSESTILPPSYTHMCAAPDFGSVPLSHAGFRLDLPQDVHNRLPSFVDFLIR